MTDELPYLTSLRGVCALAVLISHCTWWPRGGHAVEIFFVLSGYVLTWGHIRRPRGSLEFWRARLARTAPTHLVATALVGTAMIAAGSATFDQLLTNLALLPVIAERQMPINGPTWSLALEWVAYLLFPVAVIGICRAPVAACFFCTAAFLLRLLLLPAWSDWQWFPIVLHVLAEFGIGASLAAMGLVPRPTRWLRWFDSRPLLWLGQISYPLYLIQALPLFLLCGGINPNAGFLRHAAAAVAALCLGAALHVLVERPAQLWFKRHRYAVAAAGQGL
jgi:peptidoglycan/LPS O-acetylase OafA/YrhL